MKTNFKLMLALLAGVFVCASATAQEGVWLTQSGNLEVKIAPCGPATLCGTVVREVAHNAMSPAGAAMAGKNAPSAVGMKILRDLTRSDDKEWKGHIFNRENGETYDCILSVGVAGELSVHGYKGVRALGRTQTWTRVADRAPQ